MNTAPPMVDLTTPVESAKRSEMSMFKGKAGFVIPKNKFSGSLVPIFKKSESDNAASKESNKQPQRKTKWGTDLTQDAAVKRGRALAYQTRVDQITQQLKLGSLRSDNQNSKSARDVPDSELTDTQKLQCLELERREAIGEILKINPSFKTPSDYQPVIREKTVSIPVKAHPEYNFLDLVFGSDGETQKRLEKDTGTTMKVYGIKTETREKVEITPSNRTEAVSICEEVYVQILADSYEKVDAAADLIEMLLSSVLVKPADSGSVSEVDTHVLVEDQNMAAAHAINTVISSQEIVRPGPGPMLNFHQGHYQQNPISWFPGGQFSSASGAMPFNPSDQRPFRPGRPAPYGFFSSSQSTTTASPRLHSPALVMQGSFVQSPSPLIGQQSPSFAIPQHAERSLTGAASSPGWPVPVSGGPQSLSSPAPSVTPQLPSPQVAPASATSFGPPQIRFSSAFPLQSFAPHVQLNSSANTGQRPFQFPVPPSSVSPSPQSGMPSPGQRYGPSFTPLNPVGATAPRPPFRGSGDFTFQPRLSLGPPSQPLPRSGMHFASQRPSEAQLPPEPQMPSFRPATQSTVQPVGPSFPRASGWNQLGPPSGQFGAPNFNMHMGPRNHGPAPQFPNSAGSEPATQFHQRPSRPRGIFCGDPRPGPYGRRQYYDPLLPPSLTASQPQGSNIGVPRKQESDPEYEDLMASVGVK